MTTAGIGLFKAVAEANNGGSKIYRSSSMNWLTVMNKF